MSIENNVVNAAFLPWLSKQDTELGPGKISKTLGKLDLIGTEAPILREHWKNRFYLGSDSEAWLQLYLNLIRYITNAGADCGVTRGLTGKKPGGGKANFDCEFLLMHGRAQDTMKFGYDLKAITKYPKVLDAFEEILHRSETKSSKRISYVDKTTKRWAVGNVPFNTKRVGGAMQFGNTWAAKLTRHFYRQYVNQGCTETL